jgi:hypothetical protein
MLISCAMEVGRADELRAQHLLHGLDHPALPQEAVAATRAEFADGQLGRLARDALELRVEPDLGACVHDVELRARQQTHLGTRVELVDDREEVDLPVLHVEPRAARTQLELAGVLVDRDLVVRQLRDRHAVDVAVLEQAGFAVVGLAPHVDDLAGRVAQRLDVIQLLLELADREVVRQPHVGRAVRHGERHPGHRVLLVDRGAHEPLVRVVVQTRAHDRVETVVVVVGALREVHLRPFSSIRRLFP